MRLLVLVLAYVSPVFGQLSQVGSSCQENIDCKRGGYCDGNKRCRCLSTFITINSYCWIKVNPGQSGCTYSQQCAAIWPGAYCSSGVCRCRNNAPPFDTNDGPVCVNFGNCPINGENTKYKMNDGSVTTCPFGLNLACPVSHDCFCNQQDCTATGVVTYCCPTRALACIQELDQGTNPLRGPATTTRWHYNPISGTCDSFRFRGEGGNANNFESENQCLSYCATGCDRGNPQYNPYVGTRRTTTIRYCTSAVSATSPCDSTHDCSSVGTLKVCCPSTSFICSNVGGIDYASLGAIQPTTNFDPGSTGGQSITYPRWYYNRAIKRCLPFTFNGYGGNFNNFLSEEHCSSFCADVLCSAGLPLKDQSGIAIVSCSGTNTCPANYQCTSSSVCCPRKEYVCKQPQDPGSCAAFTDNWWYNAGTGNCETFTYGGCQGNENNFSSRSKCLSFCRDANTEPKCPQGNGLKNSNGQFVVCGGVASANVLRNCPSNYVCYYDGSIYGCCPTQAFTCSITLNQGTLCGVTSTRWYYNSATKTCQTFTYNGCDGNSNNFATQTDCQDYCGVLGGCPDGGDPFQESTGQYRICSGGNTCPSTHFCTQVSLGTSTTYNYCCPTRTYICSLAQEQGDSCGGSTIRYSFNSFTKSCQSFTFNGCGGNRNNFATVTQCLNYCNSAGCPAGQIALTDSRTRQVVSCDGTNTCPSSYTCASSPLLGQNTCCGSSAAADSCPIGQSAYIDSFTSSPRQCQANVQGTCPSGYICWFSVSQNQYYCCGSQIVQCTKGGSPYIDAVSNSARQCTPGVPGACPANYNCETTPIAIGTVPSVTGYCCGGSTVCGSGFESYNLNNEPVVCNPTVSTTCPSPFSCTRSRASNQYYCCRRIAAQGVNVCAEYGEDAYELDNASVVCSTGSTRTNCPSPYRCRLYATANTFYCCKPRATFDNACPPGFNPRQGGAEGFVFCSPSQPESCPGGLCQFESLQSRYICCSSTSVILTTTIQTTTPVPIARCPDNSTTSTLCTSTPCSAGLSCTSFGSRQYCCPQINLNICPNGVRAYQNPTTGQAQSCFPGVVFGCPSGFICETSPLDLGFYCCPGASPVPRNNSSSVVFCPTGTSVYVTGNSPVLCNGDGAASCPSGYRCLRASNGISYCCGSPTPSGDGGCDLGSPFLYPGTSVPLGCNKPNERGVCPAGYTCRPSTSAPGSSQCCSTTSRRLRPLSQ